jgi:hypothetical protein
MVEECDFDRQFLFDKDVAIQFHRYGHVRFKKGIIEKLTDNSSFVLWLCKNWIFIAFFRHCIGVIFYSLCLFYVEIKMNKTLYGAVTRWGYTNEN